MRARYGARVWAGLIVYLIALLGPLLLCSGFFGSHSLWGVSKCATPFALADVGDSASGRAVRPCVAQSSLEPDDFPDNIYPDEIMTGTVATQSYLSPTTPAPSVFS